MTENYTSWPLEKLRKERQKIDKAIELAEKRDKKATLQQMAALAKKNGFELHELMPGSSSAPAKSASTSKTTGKRKLRKKTIKARAKVPPKYAHPDDPKKTWTGRGRNPLWVSELLDSGKSLDDLLIDSSDD